jgi:lipopolysaccharide transport protein LptA
MSSRLHHTKLMKRVLSAIGIMCCLGIIFPGLSSGQETADNEKKPALSLEKSEGLIAITGDEFEYNNEKKIVTWSGNTKVVQGETSMFSDKLVVHLDQTGERQFEKAVATGDVRLVYNDITATGEQGIFYNNEQKFELEEKAKVWQGKNTITAHRIVALLEEEIIEGYADPTSERAIMTIYSQKKSENTDNTSEQEASPIVIESDELRLDNPNQKAIFTGNIIVTQDNSKIWSDEMIVYTTGTEETGYDIEKSELFGNVRIVQENITITGEKGLYNDSEQYVRIEGSSEEKARAEDKKQNMTLEAPIIEVFLETNNIRATGPTRTWFGTDESEGSSSTDEPTPTPAGETNEGSSQTNKKDLPSVTLYPKKEKNK